jgi:hypothetical protein
MYALADESRIDNLVILSAVWRERRQTKPPATTCGKQG